MSFSTCGFQISTKRNRNSLFHLLCGRLRRCKTGHRILKEQNKVRMGFNRGFSQALCGGTIIDDEWIVTAAHCCENRDSVDVTVGDHSRFSTETGEFSVNSGTFLNKQNLQMSHIL